LGGKQTCLAHRETDAHDPEPTLAAFVVWCRHRGEDKLMRRREFIALLSGAAAGWSLPVLAQQGKITKIGILSLGYPDPSIFLMGLREGLHDLGYDEGRSIELVVRSAGGKPMALASLAAEIVALRVDVIVAHPTTAGIAAKKETNEIPIVVYGGDLEATNLVASLARPGGNVTGVGGATAELAAKNLELIAELLPAARRVAVFANADSLFGSVFVEHARAAAPSLKFEIKSVLIHDSDQLDAAFASLEDWKVDALLIHPALPQERIAALALKHRLPAVSPSSPFCGAGGLASYSADIRSLSRQCATFVDKILKGRKPSDLPVELPTRFRLIVNLNTAGMIGMSIPPALLARADELID
jgi:putative tryptophan/tyrosine transport system substrate-binding protein